MADKAVDKKTKTIELWDGFTVEFDQQMADDVDFMKDLSMAINNNDIPTMIEMYFDLIGGEDTYEKVKEHIVNEKGYFSQEALQSVLKKIDDQFPKVGNRASRRSWKNSTY